ncbi:peptidoglycan recognition family protein [Mycolicibacterium sp. P1-18]|uniref:peptidoglycan recognition protein family protein n=1 Tax=Mycolicibacterium sp. P1-18 TaxID=2024615 RepID=UPI001F5B2AE9|nr:peptidoglycan recognition family protein [Mycolicibacterium sp. P1-18]
MTIHHTGVVLGENRHAAARLRQHRALHQNEHGWVDIAYHVGVDRNGNIYQLRDPWLEGDTAHGVRHHRSFLVLCEGYFDEEAVSPTNCTAPPLPSPGQRPLSPSVHLRCKGISIKPRLRVPGLICIRTSNLESSRAASRTCWPPAR